MNVDPPSGPPTSTPSLIGRPNDVEAGWERFFSTEQKAVEDRLFLGRRLRSWAEEQGIAEAALYTAARAGEYRLGATCGGTRFPQRLLEGDSFASDWGRVDLPQAVLLHGPGKSAPEVSDPTLLLLAAGACISGLKRQIQEQAFQARFRGVELEALYEVGLAIASTLDFERLCEEALLRAVSLLDARRGALYLLEEGEYRLTSKFGGSALERFEVGALDQEALTQGEARGPEGWLPEAEHLLAVPVETEGTSRGLLVVADKESRRGVGPFPSTDRRTLALFANQAAIAIENAKLHQLALEKERLEREMELAAEIQQQILPKVLPDVPGFEVFGWNRPARQAGGDYFDLRGLAEKNSWGLVVGDVTGKGLPAAMLVSTLHSALRVLLDRMDVGPELVDQLNRHIYESSSANKFITLILASLDTDENRITFLNAGHNPGLLLRADGSVEELGSSGLPLGLMPKCQYQAAEIGLGPGELLCLYSDGITECESPEEEELGQERLVDLLKDHASRSLEEIAALIDRTVAEFAEGLPQGDDQTVLLVRRAG